MRFGVLTSALVLAGAVAAMSTGITQAGPSPAEIIKARQQHFKDIGKAAKEMGDQLKSGAPDKAVVQAKTQEIASIMKGLPTWFPAGSGPEAGAKTAAKPEIWAKPDEFKKAYDNAQSAADELAKVAATGDVAAIGKAAQGLGQGCGGCHKPFRVKQEGEG